MAIAIDLLINNYILNILGNILNIYLDILINYIQYIFSFMSKNTLSWVISFQNSRGLQHLQLNQF